MERLDDEFLESDSEDTGHAVYDGLLLFCPGRFAVSRHRAPVSGRGLVDWPNVGGISCDLASRTLPDRTLFLRCERAGALRRRRQPAHRHPHERLWVTYLPALRTCGQSVRRADSRCGI